MADIKCKLIKSKLITKAVKYLTGAVTDADHSHFPQGREGEASVSNDDIIFPLVRDGVGWIRKEKERKEREEKGREGSDRTRKEGSKTIV